MKKHKSVVSILLAVMMIFAMMPAMVFAADTEPTATWNGYNSVVFAGGTGAYEKYNGTYQTTKAFVADTTDPMKGAVKVDVKDPEIGGVDVAYLQSKAPTKYYYDLSNAVIAKGTKALFDSYASFSDWTAGAPDGLLFSAPDGTYTGTKPAAVAIAATLGKVTLGGNWEGTIKTDPATVTAKEDNQDVKVFVDVVWTTATATAGVEGVVADKTVTIKASSHGTLPTTLANNLYKDEVKEGTALASADVSVAYDGKEHTLIAAPVKGYSVKYTVFNKKTGQWDAVDAVTYKDAAAKVSARATYFDDAKASDANYKGETPLAFSVTVGKSSAVPTLQFTDDAKAPDTFVKGKYDAWDLVVVKNAEDKADNAALLAYFKDAYTIEETSTSAFDATEYTWSFKAVTPAPKTADYAILANYAAPVVTTNPHYATKDVTILESDPDDDYEVEFTKAPSKKTYHIKKAKKTKKAYSFTVKAEASNGAAVKYKLINADNKIKIDKASGKITLKKGLAKGTYNIKVKAYVPAENRYGYAEETQAIKIVIKK